MAQQVNILSLSIDTQQLIQRLSQTRQQIEQLQASQRTLTQAGQTSSQQFIQQAAQLSNLQRQYNQQQNVVTQLNAANNQAATATQAVNTALNRNITTIAEATENNRQLTAVRNQLNLSTQQGRDALEQINRRLNENTEFIRANVSAQEQQRMNIGNYSDSIQEALQNLNPFNGGIQGFTQRAQQAGGAGALLTQSFSQLTTGIGGVTRAALGFIATPIGAAITAVVAAFAAGKAIFDYNQGLKEANKELKSLGVNAADLSNVRSEITATAETFDKEFKDIATKANSLSKAYGISLSEANNIIAQGLASGGAQNEEFLDSLGEYDQLFANAGYSAQEFVNIVNQGYELGIYADKLPDAIKEADLALKEQTKATRDALVNAFGASFTDDILKQVRTGEITTANALDTIAEKSKETSLTQQQQAQLTADLFKGAGEDAGGAMAILTAVNQAANKELDNTAKKQLELQESTERLNKAQAELFEVKGFGDIWASIKIASTDALSALLEGLSDIKKDLQPVIDLVAIVFKNAWESLKTTFAVVFDFIGGSFRVMGNTVKTFIDFFKAVISGDFSGAIDALKNGFTNLLNIVGNTFGKIKNSIISGLQGIVKNISPILETLGVDVDKLQKKLDGLKSKNIEVKASTSSTTSSTSKEVVADVKTADELKRIADEKKKIAADQEKASDRAIQKEIEALDFFIASQSIKKKSLQDELALEEEIMRKKLALLETERKAGKKSGTAYETEKLNIKNAYAKKQADLAVQLAADELAEVKKNLETQKNDNQFFTEEKLGAAIQYNNNLAQAERDYQLVRKEAGVINEQEYNEAINLINEENRKRNEDAEKERSEAKKEQEAIDLENQRLIDEEKFINDFELELSRENLRYQEELKAAEKTGVDTTKIEQKHNNNKKKIEDTYQAAKVAAYGQTFGQIATLLGENTAAGKAAAIAQATISTYQGIAEVWAAKSVLPEPIGTIAKVASTGVVLASGLGAVKKITGVPIPSRAGGGEIPTLRTGMINNGSNIAPLRNGDDTLAYVKQGEVILNRDQQIKAGGSMFFKSIGVPGFAGGGIVGGNSNVGPAGIKIDMDALAAKIGQEVGRANLNLPAPITILDDITTAQASTSRIVAGASF